MHRLLTGSLGFIFCLFLSTHTIAQQVDATAVRALFPDANAVVLNKNQHLTIDIKSTTLQVQSEESEEIYYVNNDDISSARKSIHFNDFEPVTGIYAKTLVPVPGKSKYKTYEVDNFTTKDILHGGVFYSDSRIKSFVFPNVQTGAITSVQFSQSIKEPRFLTPFYFSEYLPTLSSEFSVTFPETVKLKWKLFGIDSDQVAFSETVNKGKITYTWKAQNLKAILSEKNAPNHAYFATHLAIYINKATINGSEVTYFGTTNDLYQWYHSLVKNINQGADAQLKLITQEVIKGATTNTEKARLVFQWVQKNIRYIAFEDGWSGFIPMDASEVCSKRYGDCKGMANLTQQMLSYANVPANLTWIGTRSIPYAYDELPIPIVDNHMIVSLELDNQTMFLDATDSHVPFGLPSAMIQGKEALIGQGEKGFKVIKVPVMNENINKKTDITTLRIQGKELIGSSIAQLTGYKKTDFEYHYLGKSESDIKDFMIDYLEKGNDKFTISQSEVAGLNDQNSDLKITYQFTLRDYLKQVGGSIYVNMNLEKKLRDDRIDLPKRLLDREFEYKYSDIDRVELTIPEEYTIQHLPANASYSHPDFDFNIHYTQKENKVFLDRQIRIKNLMLPKAKFPAWNDMINQLLKSYQDVLILEKKA